MISLVPVSEITFKKIMFGYTWKLVQNVISNEKLYILHDYIHKKWGVTFFNRSVFCHHSTLFFGLICIQRKFWKHPGFEIELSW